MKFIISSKYFYEKVTEALNNEAEFVDFNNGVMHFVNGIPEEGVFVSIEKITEIQDQNLKLDRNKLYDLLHFLKLLEEQPIVVEVNDFGFEYSAQFQITQCIAKF